MLKDFKNFTKEITINRSCPICSCTGNTFLFEQNFGNKAIALMEKYNVVVCKDCGFCYANNIPSQKEFNNYYAEMSKYEFDYKAGLVSDEYLDHFNKMSRFLIPYIKEKNEKILDIGCSTGALLSILKSHGYSNLLGIDPSPSCVETVKQLYNIEAVANTISSFKSDKNFDVIILSAVLEHFVDFTDAMQKIRSLLNDEGLLFIEIPDAERFDSYIYTPFQQFSIEHINYFSQYSVKNLLIKFSFEIIEIQKNENRINQNIDPNILVLSRKSNKNNFEITRDDVCELKLNNYISESYKMDIKLKKIIQEKLSNKNKIIIWGVGTHTQRLIGSGLDCSKILFFVDSNTNYKGKMINGIEVKLPDEIKENIPILVSTYSYQDEVVRQIKDELKLTNEIIQLY